MNLQDKKLANIEWEIRSMKSEKNRISHYPQSKNDWKSKEQRYKIWENVAGANAYAPFVTSREIEVKSQDKFQRAKDVSLPTGKSCDYTANKKGPEMSTAKCQKVSSFDSSKKVKSDTMSAFTSKELAYLTNSAFPQLLMRILSDEDAVQGINWCLDGKAITIVDRDHLVSSVLPRFFEDLSCEKLMQLFDCWGFVKVEDNAYKHEMFQHEVRH